ncbi:MAG: cohesin domain-containing protein [Methanosarcinales archaeon]|nr:cohesin domain-containing protein [Methanosarcinales archaeon]
MENKINKVSTMRNNKLIGKTIIIIFLILFTMQAAYAVPVISVEPSCPDVMENNRFIVNIDIDPDSTQILGVEYTLSFNNNLLKVLNQDKGQFLSQDGVDTLDILNIFDNDNGVIKYGEIRTGVDYGVDIAGTLATIEFEVISNSGLCELRIEKTIISNTSAQEIQDIIINNGRIGIDQPLTSFFIDGYVFYEDGSDCNNPVVIITNLDLEREWTAVINDNSNYYQLMLNSSVDILAGETLQFNAIGPNAGQSTVVEYTVSQAQIDDGGFELNINFGSDWRDEWMGKNSEEGSAVTTSELQDAIHHWLDDEPVRGYVLLTSDLQEVITVWMT